MSCCVGLFLAATLALVLPAGRAVAAACDSWVAPPTPAKRVTAPLWGQRWLDADRLRRLGSGSGVRVAVLDSGVDPTHPQLANAIEPGWDVVTGTAGGNLDCTGHGTAVSSLLAARAEHDAALVGVAPEATIVPIRVSADGNGATSYRDVTPARLAEGVRRALSLRVAVIQVSFVVVTDTPELRLAVADAVRQGVVVVAAAGDGTAGPTYPAAYDGVLGVGAIDADGLRWSESGVGAHVDLVAPGVDLLAASRVAGHTLAKGTAAAAALVAGAAALLRANHPDWTATRVMRQLVATADGTSGGAHSQTYGFGCVNPYRALAEPAAAAGPSPGWTAAPPAVGVQPSRPGWSTATRRALLLASAVGSAAALVAIGYAAALVVRRRRA
jgi:membrane-anchored mycosin MYCP